LCLCHLVVSSAQGYRLGKQCGVCPGGSMRASEVGLDAGSNGWAEDCLPSSHASHDLHQPLVTHREHIAHLEEFGPRRPIPRSSAGQVRCRLLPVVRGRGRFSKPVPWRRLTKANRRSRMRTLMICQGRVLTVPVPLSVPAQLPCFCRPVAACSGRSGPGLSACLE